MLRRTIIGLAAVAFALSGIGFLVAMVPGPIEYCPETDECPEPECREQDGSNIRLCGFHDYGDGLALEWADPISSFFVCLDGPDIRVEAWISRADYAAGLDSVMVWTPQNADRPYCAGYGLAPNPMVVTRLIGEVSVVEDVVYAADN